MSLSEIIDTMSLGPSRVKLQAISRLQDKCKTIQDMRDRVVLHSGAVTHQKRFFLKNPFSRNCHK